MISPPAYRYVKAPWSTERMDINLQTAAEADAPSTLFNTDELPELTAVAVIQESLIENLLLALFEKGTFTAEEVRVIVRSAGVSLASEVAEWRSAGETKADEEGANRMGAAGEVYLEELEESILGRPDTDISLDSDADTDE
jgi:hypothetical protein